MNIRPTAVPHHAGTKRSGVPDSCRRPRRRGLTATLAMIFLCMAAILSLGMYAASTTSTSTANNLLEGERARFAAESGLRWIAWRFERMSRPKTPIGNITGAVATTLWPSIRTSTTNDLSAMLTSSERPTTFVNGVFSTSPIAADESGLSNPNGARFVITVRPHPIGTGDPLDARYLKVTSTGTYRGTRRILSMDFLIDKKVKFAIVGKVPIQLGRNTLVEGPVGMATANKYPPIYMLSDFSHLNSTLSSRIDSFNNFLAANHNGFDNRISVANAIEYTKATQANYSDYTSDGYIDEYDLFVKYYDRNGDAKIQESEFKDTSGKLYDADLFTAIDTLGMPLTPTEALRVGLTRNSSDTIVGDRTIDKYDAYSKIRGQISVATTADAWKNNLGSGQTIGDNIVGPITSSESGQQPVKFGAAASDLFDLSPTNFDTSSFRAQTGPSNGPTSTSGGAQVTLTNKVLTTTDNQVMQVTNPGETTFTAGSFVLKSDFDAANAPLPTTKRATGTNVTPANANEHAPFGSTSWQATYARPVFRNMKFKNVRIPKGINALFDNCTFEGVTYIEVTTNITTPGGATTTNKDDGMTWSKRMRTGSFDSNTPLTATNSYGFTDGNNVRFNNCTVNGPLTSDVPTAYTHFTNSWEFTGATTFDNKWIDPNSGQTTATIIAPQANIEMGSFTDPSSAPSTLTGVVVAGNLDIRGTSVVDGSIIITGDGAGNTTQGWFGPNDGSTDPSSPMPEGGWGRLNIRYNPYRALPDGINVAIDIVADVDSYAEGK